MKSRNVYSALLVLVLLLLSACSQLDVSTAEGDQEIQNFTPLSAEQPVALEAYDLRDKAQINTLLREKPHLKALVEEGRRSLEQDPELSTMQGSTDVGGVCNGTVTIGRGFNLFGEVVGVRATLSCPWRWNNATIDYILDGQSDGTSRSYLRSYMTGFSDGIPINVVGASGTVCGSASFAAIYRGDLYAGTGSNCGSVGSPN